MIDIVWKKKRLTCWIIIMTCKLQFDQNAKEKKRSCKHVS